MILSQLLDLCPGGVGLYDLRHTPDRVYLSLVTQLLRKGRTVTTPIQLLDRESERGVVFEMNTHGEIVYFNRRSFERRGVSDAHGSNWRDAMHPDEVASVDARWAQIGRAHV